MSWLTKPSPVMLERIVVLLSYMTCGIAGILYSIFKPNQAKSLFFRFNFIQGIMLSLIMILLNMCIDIFQESLMSILSFLKIGILSAIFGTIMFYLKMVINIGSPILMLYCIVWSALGKYPEIPLISSQARKQI